MERERDWVYEEHVVDPWRDMFITQKVGGYHKPITMASHNAPLPAMVLEDAEYLVGHLGAEQHGRGGDSGADCGYLDSDEANFRHCAEVLFEEV